MSERTEIEEKSSASAYRDPKLLIEQKPVESSSELPAYVAIRDALVAEIRAGTRTVGSSLPSERDLAERHSVARMTARRALALLVADGLVHRADRKGYFVSAPRICYRPSSSVNMMRQLREQGLLTENIYLGRRLLDATEWHGEKLRIPVGAPVVLERFVVIVEGRRVFYGEDHLNLALLPGYETEPFISPMTQNLQRLYGVEPKVRFYRMRVTNLSFEAAQYLETGPEASAVSTLRVEDHKNDGLMACRGFWLSDAVDMILEE